MESEIIDKTRPLPCQFSLTLELSVVMFVYWQKVSWEYCRQKAFGKFPIYHNFLQAWAFLDSTNFTVWSAPVPQDFEDATCLVLAVSFLKLMVRLVHKDPAHAHTHTHTCAHRHTDTHTRTHSVSFKFSLVHFLCVYRQTNPFILLSRAHQHGRSIWLFIRLCHIASLLNLLSARQDF